MPPFGPRFAQQMRGEEDPEWFAPTFIAMVFGTALFTVALVSAPIWGPAVALFLASHPGISGTAFWAVVKAVVKKENPFKAGLKAGLDASAVALIVEFIKKYLWFIPSQ